VLLLPLLKQKQLVGALFLEDTRAPGTFTPERLAVLDLLGSQAASSLENARLYADLQRERGRLRDSEERFSMAFQESPTPRSIARQRDGALVEINKAALEMLGVSRQKAFGRNMAELDVLTEEQRALLVAAMDARGSVRGLEMVARVKGGERNVLVSVDRIELGGEPCFLSTAYDITGHKKTEEQLRQAQKMEGIGRLAGGVAHDFNNLLTVINGYSELGLRELDEGHRAHQAIHQILKAGERAASLTRQLLVYSRKQVLEPQHWDLNVIVREMESILRRIIGEDVRFVTELSPDVGTVNVDRGQVEQIVLNLVVNARDAMPEGGDLLVRIGRERVDAPSAGEPTEIAPGSYVVLTVVDSGTGIPPEVRAQIFEPFFTTKEAGRGTGLGLSVVYGIVKQSGGYISVDTEVGRGTAFRILFPEVSPRRAAPSVQDDARATGEHRGHEAILVVEDDPGVRGLIGYALGADGYEVLEANDGAQALRILESRRVDLVVTDVVMPVMGGPALARRLQALDSAPPIVFVSGYAERPAFADAPPLPGHFLQKPLNPFKLVRKVRELLDQVRR
jgi:PAS domain S-box-containing protein